MTVKARGFLRTQLATLVVITLAACSVVTPSGSGVAGSIAPEQSAGESSANTGMLHVEVRNHDAVAYRIAWAQELDRIAWSVDPASFGHFVLASTEVGTLLLTAACNFNGTWEIGPGSYRVVIEDGIATIASVPSIGSSVGLVPAEPCPHQGP